ncbi:MAG: GNAT family N-acetyltransferase [Muribaculaceae bacterium]|nr:GNAT family N-acetyltransferase [Muribaculaceae bacterium]
MQPNVAIQAATSEQASHIARLIMMAMSDDCCRYFCGSRHTLDDFYAMMTRLVLRDDSQYSYRNTLVALDGNQVVGAAVAYDGAELHTLRRAFVAMAHEYLDMDLSHMGDETQPGELYLDSLAVLPEYRHRGIAARLLETTKERARVMRLPAVGLLVDQDNPGARSLYEAAGFHYVNDNTWGGHLMRHLVCKIHSNSDL